MHSVRYEPYCMPHRMPAMFRDYQYSQQQMNAVVQVEDLPPYGSLEELLQSDCTPQFPPANLDIPDIMTDNSTVDCQHTHIQVPLNSGYCTDQVATGPNVGVSPATGSINEHNDGIHPQMSQMQQGVAAVHRRGTTTSIVVKNKVKTASKKRKKRDPNEPQKPVSAYALFFRDSQASIKTRNPNMSFGEVSKLVAHMWEDLDADSKAMYRKRTETAKKEYLKQLAAYRASLVSKGPLEGESWSGVSSGSSADGSPPPVSTTYLSTPSIASPLPSPQAYGEQTVMPSGELMCVRQGCKNGAIHDPAWDRDYCSNECVATHCRDVFTQWVARQNQTSVK
ncbi:DgyrCDS6520 [Dimorphilus gyrociliatus]|uniref:DgyrCDS6520 n=1 Tax=Dimorphilus gyrociliatus TaxID=2664684 RepID=A0A7I8VQL3_9ANNE|nr:DgyrCDS6520 [Dimorphilus gyrociliatus]